MIIVTAGAKYIDIDAYAGCIAYAELLRKQGQDAQAISTAVLNESITETVRSWLVAFGHEIVTDERSRFVLIDISEPEFFDAFVELESVHEVIDHHPGFEQYWQERIGEKAQIEPVGAAATLVHERWCEAGLMDEMSTASARLLLTAILDNTLNFGASITTERDTDAYRALFARAGLPDDWPAQYFTECQAAITADLTAAIQNDTKTLTFASKNSPMTVGQLVVWDAQPIIKNGLSAIEENLAHGDKSWFMNLVNIGEGKSYLVCKDPATQAWLAELLGVRFAHGIGMADRLWLRKEIMTADIELRAKHSG